MPARFDALPRRDRLAVVGLVAVVTVVAVLERLVLFFRVDPFAVILGPPVLTAVAFAAVEPRIRSIRSESTATTTDEPSESDPDDSIASYRRYLRTGVAAVVVHCVAVVGGVGLFVLIDTPIRYLLYWSGHGPFSFATVTRLGIGGVAAATAVVWGLSAVPVVHTTRGSSLRTALRRGLSDPVARPRSGAITGGVHGLIFALVLVSGRVIPWNAIGSDRLETLLLLGGLIPLVVLANTVLVVHQFARADRPPVAPFPNRRAVVRLAVAALLVTSLVGVAGAVRVTETRPTADPEPLPDDPTEAYATALENTDRASVAVSIEYHRDDVDYGGITEWRRDRDNRRQRVYQNESDEPLLWYNSAGTWIRHFPPIGTGVETETDGERDGRWIIVNRAAPGYWERDAAALGPTVLLPPARTGSALFPSVENEWTVVEETDDELVVERVRNSSERYDERRTRMTIDTEREIVTGGETYAVANESADDAESRSLHERHTEYDVEADVSVERPAELGSPSVSEWTWKLLAY